MQRLGSEAANGLFDDQAYPTTASKVVAVKDVDPISGSGPMNVLYMYISIGRRRCGVGTEYGVRSMEISSSYSGPSVYVRTVCTCTSYCTYDIHHG